MDNAPIYSKTSKGINELKSGAKNIPRDDARVLTLINGTSSIDDLSNVLDVAINKKLASTLGSLLDQGFIRIFSNASSTPPHNPALDMRVPTQYTADGMVKFTPALPTIQVTEHTLQESVQAWSEARRGAAILEKKGFYTYEVQKSASVNQSTETLRVMVVEDDESLADFCTS